MSQQAYRTVTRIAATLSTAADDLERITLPADAPELAAAEIASEVEALRTLLRRAHILGLSLLGESDALGERGE
jgi:hypothetical protein